MYGGRRRLSSWQSLIKKHPGVPFTQLSRMYRSRSSGRRSRKGGCGGVLSGAGDYMYFGAGNPYASNPYIDNYYNMYETLARRGAGKKEKTPPCLEPEVWIPGTADGKVKGHYYCPSYPVSVRTDNPAIKKEIKRRFKDAAERKRLSEKEIVNRAALENLRLDNLKQTQAYESSLGYANDLGKLYENLVDPKTVERIKKMEESKGSGLRRRRRRSRYRK